jgi:hypothetical protein
MFWFTVAGRHDFFAESTIVFSGLSPKISANWIISRVEYTLRIRQISPLWALAR